ncbi:MAG: hypothetical protein KR126chlam4_00159, partial [Candidatus Anoxychlamydiales bacterium]|nr:hypothetical protein [Candidatus Anoxychlamydiales bacterium]
MFKKLIASLTFLLFLTFLSAYAVSTKSYQYDDKIIQITDPREISLTYEYDNFNRLILKKYPNGRKIEYEYDNIGHRTK